MESTRLLRQTIRSKPGFALGASPDLPRGSALPKESVPISLSAAPQPSNGPPCLH